MDEHDRPDRSDRPDRPPKPRAPEPPRFGGARNDHGTHISRRVVCQRCGKEDHTQLPKNDPASGLCRECATEVTGRHEEGREVAPPTRTLACVVCGAPFELPVHIEDDGERMCRNCFRGHTDWQGSVETPHAERSARPPAQERRAGLRLRPARKGAPPAGGDGPDSDPSGN